MINIDSISEEDFLKMPLVVEGESKEVRYCGAGFVVIRLKPTIYSYTHNRSGSIPGSDVERLKAIASLLPVLKKVGIEHSYKQVNNRWILSELVLQPHKKGQKSSFIPNDLNEEQIKKLAIAPPIEVIGKARHTGTSKHRYFDFDKYPTRSGTYLDNDSLYPEPVIRFDWRNPLIDPEGNRLADEVLPLQTAELFIDTARAEKTARKTFVALSNFFRQHDLDLWDICFIIDQSGAKVFGEISPDCMRIRSLDGASLDKDVWRRGGSHEDVLKKWQIFNEKIAVDND